MEHMSGWEERGKFFSSERNTCAFLTISSKKPGQLYRNVMIQGWGDGADDMVVWCKREALSLDSQHSPEKPGVVINTCDPSARQVETGESLGLAGLPV